MRTYPTLLVMIALVLGGCRPAGPGTAEPAAAPVLRVLTHDSFALSADLVSHFESENGARLEFIKGGDAGTVLNKALLTRGSPIADVLYGLDNTYLSRALANDLLDPYPSPALAGVPGSFQLDPSRSALPVDYGDVCINYDKAYFAGHSLALPASLDDLLKPEYRSLLVVEDPASSSPGLAFLLATVAQYGEDGYQDYWRALKENGLVVAGDWQSAYYTDFSASSGRGPQPMVVSYGTSPAAEVLFAAEPLTEAPTASLVAPGMCFRQVEFVGILKGTEARSLAERFVDFMLSPEVQADIPLQMFMFPVREGTALPPAFSEYVQVPGQPAALAPEAIDRGREQWLKGWTEAVLR